jgi:quinoprotein glucose dehydrogenase
MFRRRRVVEADLCIIGSGITAAMVAEKVSELRDARIVVVEAGDEVLPLEQRPARRQRFLDYGENPWPDDHIDGLSAQDPLQSRSMQVGGQAMHWGGVTPRFSPEDFRLNSLYGIGDDWPITYDDLDPFYQEAEERLGVAGEQGPPEMDPRGAPFPMPPIPLSYNLSLFREWGAQADIPFWSQPSAKTSVQYRGRAACCRSDTCSPICPVGAKYSPDMSWNRLRAEGRVQLIPRTFVRRLVPYADSERIEVAIGVNRDAPDTPIEFRAPVFVVAGGYVWSSHLLLNSASSRFPSGIANRSGLVGKYLAGHRGVSAQVRLPLRLYPGMNLQHSLLTKKFMRAPDGRYVRHDLRIWESDSGSTPRLRDDDGNLLIGDALMADWRRRAETGAARIRAYYDVLPARESELTLDPDNRSPWGDPLPRLSFRDSAESAELRQHTEDTIRARFDELVRAGDGQLGNVGRSSFQDHPAGGCRMGADPSSSVVQASGRAHDHENLFVVGAPTCVTASCANGTLTFSAVALLQASALSGHVAVPRG